MSPGDPNFGLMMTAIGMGTVFATLIMLAMFTFLFNKFFAGRNQTDAKPSSAPAAAPARAATPAPIAPPSETKTAPVDPVRHEKLKRAAAIAVSILLAVRAKPLPIFRPRETGGESWRQTYRQRFLTRHGRRA